MQNPMLSNGHTNNSKSTTRTLDRCIFLSRGRICLIHVKEEDYYRLPSGNIEADTCTQTANAENEALQNPGCAVEIIPWWSPHFTQPWVGRLNRESFGFVCTLDARGNDKGVGDCGGKYRWCSPMDAWRVMKKSEPTSEVAELMKKRDMFILQAYLRHHAAEARQEAHPAETSRRQIEEQCCDGAVR